MTETAADFDTRFRQSRAADLSAININTFWSIAILLNDRFGHEAGDAVLRSVRARYAHRCGRRIS